MFNKEQIEKIDQYLHKNFDIIFDFEFTGLMLLFGGAVKDIIMDKPINDLDFLLLTQTDDNIKQFLDIYKLTYKQNKYKGYSIIYNDIKIDINITNDLYYTGTLNTDMLFYDIKNKQLIPIGIKYALVKNEIVEYYYKGYFKARRRIKRGKNFIKFINNNNKRVKVRYNYNRFFQLIFSFLKNPQKIIRIFSKEDKYVKYRTSSKIR